MLALAANANKTARTIREIFIGVTLYKVWSLLGVGQQPNISFAYTAAEAAESILIYGNFPQSWAVTVGLRQIALSRIHSIQKKFDEEPPRNEYERGVFRGKVSALRWAKGGEWESPET